MFYTILASQIIINALNVIIFQALAYFLSHSAAMRVETIGESIFANMSTVLLSIILSRLQSSVYLILCILSFILVLNYFLFSFSVYVSSSSLFVASWYLNRSLTSASSYMRDQYLSNQSSQKILTMKVLKQLLGPVICVFLAIAVRRKDEPYFSNYKLLWGGIILCLLFVVNGILLSLLSRSAYSLSKEMRVQDKKEIKIRWSSVIIAFISIFCIGLAPADQFLTSILPIYKASIYKSSGQLLAILIPSMSYLPQMLIYYLLTALLYPLCFFIQQGHYNDILAPIFCIIWGILMSLRSILCLRALKIVNLGRSKMIVYYLALSSASLFFNLVLFEYTRSLNLTLFLFNLFFFIVQTVLLHLKRG